MLALWSKGLHERSQITSKPSSSNFVKCLEDSAHVLTFPAPAPGKQAGPSLGCKAVAASMIGRKRCSEICQQHGERGVGRKRETRPALGVVTGPPRHVSHRTSWVSISLPLRMSPMSAAKGRQLCGSCSIAMSYCSGVHISNTQWYSSCPPEHSA